MKDVVHGFGLAAFELQNALLTTFVSKGVLTMKEAALTCQGALVELQKRRPTNQEGEQVQAVAVAALTTLSQGWGAQARGN
jgi:hypothetical protein